MLVLDRRWTRYSSRISSIRRRSTSRNSRNDRGREGFWSGARKSCGASCRNMNRRFHPVVRKWFAESLGKPSEPQRKGWPAIASGSHTLILAPTGTGKTLAAFLWELNALIVEGMKQPLTNG